MSSLSRKPPAEVRRQLRREVGFGCPAPGCGNPYLEYHHFDPEWHVKPHHNPAGMVALCATHHAKADAWTIEQCRALKGTTLDRSVAGKFEWMRREVIGIIGGNYFHETPDMIVFGSAKLVWFERDEDGYLLLSLNMLSISGQPRTKLRANDWLIEGDPIDVESPPNGSRLRVRYENGDEVDIRFKQWETPESVQKEHPRILDIEDVSFPVVTAEVKMIAAGTDYQFDSKKSQMG
ncbi:hypothetical protein, partial [Dermacoccus barathri]